MVFKRGEIKLRTTPYLSRGKHQENGASDKLSCVLC